MTPFLQEQNAIDQLRADAQKLTDEAALRQKTLDDQIAAKERENAESGGDQAQEQQPPAEQPPAEQPVVAEVPPVEPATETVPAP